MLSIDYIAGFVDGEGCLALNINKGRFRPRVVIVNTNYHILRDIQYALEFWGIVSHIISQTSTLENARTKYALGIWNNASILTFCSVLKDHLKLKQRNAEIIVKFIFYRQQEGIHGKDFIVEEKELAAEMKELNSRGVK